MKTFLLFFTTVAVWAQPSNLRLFEATHQQIIACYEVHNASSAYTIELRDLAGNLMPDVDNSKFTNAHLDTSRTSTHYYNAGKTRCVVLGFRGYDGTNVFYSRSLQNNTTYTLSVTGNSVTKTISVTTATQPFGPNLWDPLSAKPNTSGEYKFASRNLATRDWYIEATTGNAIYRGMIPTDMSTVADRTITVDAATSTGTGWTNATGAAASGDAVAEYAGTTNEWLKIPITLNYSSFGIVTAGINLSFQAEITGGPAGTDRNIEVCVGHMGTSALSTGCITPVQTIDASTCSISAAQGQCVISSAPYFDSKWLTTSGDVLDMVHRSNILTPKTAIMFRKVSTNGSHTLRIDGLTTFTQDDTMAYGVHTTNWRACSPNTTTYNSVPYYICGFQDKINQVTAVYSLNAITGVMNFQGKFSFGSSGVGSNGNMLIWGTDPKNVYFGGTTSVPDIGKCVINSDLSTSYVASPGNQQAWQTYQGQSSTPATWTCTTITSNGFRPAQLVAAFHPDYNKYPDGTALPTNSDTDIFTNGTIQLQPGSHSGKIVYALRYIQDGGGWTFIYDVEAAASAAAIAANANASGAIIAARKLGMPGVPLHAKSCYIHSIYNLGAISNNISASCARILTTNSTTKWLGPHRIRVTNDGGGNIPTNATVLQLVGQTLSSTGGACAGGTSYNLVDPTPATDCMDEVIPLEVGDILVYVSSGTTLQYAEGVHEYMQVTAIDSGTNKITVLRGTNIANSPNNTGSPFTSITNTPIGVITANSYIYKAHGATTFNRPSGYGNAIYWDYTTNPYGKLITLPAIDNTTGDLLAWNYTGNHGDFGSYARLHFGEGQSASNKYTYACRDHNKVNEECYTGARGMASRGDLNSISSTFGNANFPPFAGTTPGGQSANTYESHPRMRNELAVGKTATSFMDVKPQIDAPTGCSIALEGGTTNIYKVTGCTLNRKHFATYAWGGDRVFKDVSSDATGNIITDATHYDFCVAMNANECRTGAAANELYFSHPRLTTTTCPTVTSATITYPMSVHGLCVMDAGPYVFGPTQIYLDRDDIFGIYSRTLDMTLRPGNQGVYAISELTGNGKFVTFLEDISGYPSYSSIKVPPAPAKIKNPLTWESTYFSVKHPSAAAAYCRVKIGHAEYGAVSDYYARQRKETSYVTTATITASTPFLWNHQLTASDYITVSGRTCTSALPNIPNRVMFVEALFYNSGKTLIGTTKKTICANGRCL